MKKYILSLILFLPGLAGAQILISSFDTISTQAYLPFNDTWNNPVDQFTQSTGYISITSVSGGDPNGDGGFHANIAGSQDGSNPVDFTGYTHLSLTARVETGNASVSTVVLIRDTAFEIIGTAQFFTDDFSTGEFGAVSAPLELSGPGVITDAAYWTVAGDGLSGSYRMSLDHLSATTIPEPSVWVLLMLGCVGILLRRKAGGASCSMVRPSYDGCANLYYADRGEYR